LGSALETARACVIEHAGGRDGHNAAALLGRLIASRGGSASFVSSELDTLASSTSADELATLRAALFEGYAQAMAEESVAARDACWDPPACIVALGEGRASIAAGFPNDAPDALSAWADRVAAWLVRAKVKRVTVSGSEAARLALEEAVATVGIELEASR